MPAHRINLRGPWKLSPGTSAGPERKVNLPAEWNKLFRSGSGRVRLSRTFHCPTNLGADEVVELVFENWPGPWFISLNQQPIAEFCDASAELPRRIDVTRLLAPTNTLTAETDLAPESGRGSLSGPFGLVALEIRAV